MRLVDVLTQIQRAEPLLPGPSPSLEQKVYKGPELWYS